MKKITTILTLITFILFINIKEHARAEAAEATPKEIPTKISSPYESCTWTSPNEPEKNFIFTDSCGQKFCYRSVTCTKKGNPLKTSTRMATCAAEPCKGANGALGCAIDPDYSSAKYKETIEGQEAAPAAAPATPQ